MKINMKYIRRFDESDSFSMIEIHVTVPLFPEKPETKWTTFFGCKFVKEGSSRHGDDCYEIEVKYFDIVWKKYKGKEMPYRDGKYGPCRPEFDEYPKELIDALTILSSSATKFVKSSSKMYYRRFGDDDISLKDPCPDKEEISEMVLKFSCIEDAKDWLDDLEYLMVTGK